MNGSQRLSPREKGLIAVLSLLVMPLGMWFLVAVPLKDARARAAAALAVAQADYIWVAEQDRLFSAASTRSKESEVTPVRIVGLEAELVARELRDRVITLEEDDGGEIRLQVRAAPFDDLGRFLEHVEQKLGYSLSEMRIAPGEDSGRVDATVGLTPR